jgi:hypothetical protein
MGEFSFRIRLTTAPQSRLNVPGTELRLELPRVEAPVVLRTFGEPKSIAESRELILRGGPYQTSAAAHEDGSRLVEAIGVAFAHLRVGVDTAGFMPSGEFTPVALDSVRQGRSEQFLNDDPGLLVFESSIPTKFVRGYPASLILGVAPARLERVMSAVLEGNIRLSAKEALSLELYHSSYFEQSERSRFLTLMIAIEALLEPLPRDPVALQFVESFITQVAQAATLADSERGALLGSLRYLRDNSISRTGRELAARRLHERVYAGLPAAKFFTYCYELRSAIVHKGRFDLVDGTDQLPSGKLDRFVGDLLTYWLLDPAA